MKLIAQVKLVVSPDQSDSLKRTMQQANVVCDSISAWAWQTQTFGQYPIHRGQYASQKARSGMAAQIIIRCISKVADAYKLDKKIERRFRSLGSIAYDVRILRWYIERDEVSIWTVDGRLRLSFQCGDYQRGLLAFQQGESDLILVNGNFYLLATCSLPDPPMMEVEGILGVDLGLVKIAVDSEGNQYSGADSRAYRRRIQNLRSGLQSRDTKSAKRHLKRIRQRERNYQRWVNHNISKQIVETAVSSRKAIALEELKGIRERVSAFGRDMRRELGGWTFAQLGTFISYKAIRKGLKTFWVEARGTSRTCRICGHCDKANRKSQALFFCVQCGHRENADDNASRNIERRGLVARGEVTHPKVSAV